MKNTEQTSEDNIDSGVLSSPLSFVRGGTYDWGNAILYNRNGGEGTYWQLRSYDTTNSGFILLSNTRLYPQYGYNRGDGFAVRCVQILHQSH